jgi:hypothetical protein
MARRRNEVRKGDIFENMDAQSSSSEEQGHLQKWVKKTEQPEHNERLKGSSKVSHLLRHTQVTVVSVMYIHRMTLYRSRTYASCCAAGRIYVVKPWEKGNAHGVAVLM